MGEREIFRDGQAATGCRQPFDRGIIGKVHEEDYALKGPGALEVSHEKGSLFVCDPHGNEHDGKLFSLTKNFCLSGNLGSELVCRATRAGEDGQFLAADRACSTRR